MKPETKRVIDFLQEPSHKESRHINSTKCQRKNMYFREQLKNLKSEYDPFLQNAHK